MATYTGLFPDRETANHAITLLQQAGLRASRMNAEDFGRPEYYEHGMPQGATLVTVESPDSDRRAEAIIAECGGQLVEAGTGGVAAVRTAFEGNPAGTVPAHPDEQRAILEKVAEERSPINTAERAAGTPAAGRMNNTGAPSE